MATSVTSNIRPMGIDDRNRDLEFRAAFAAVLQRQATGSVPDAAVFPGGANTVGDATSTGTSGNPQVTVQPFAAFVPSSTASNFGWIVRTDAAAPIDLTAPNATNPRIDLIVATVNSTDLVVTRVTGTAASSPTAPAVPADSVALWEVRVNTNGSLVFTRRADWASAVGGVRPWSSNTRNGSYSGELRINTTTGAVDAWLGGVWVQMASPAVWTQFTPTLRYRGQGGGGPGIYNLGSTGSAIGRYMVQGKSMHIRYVFRSGGTGIFGGSGYLYTTLPSGYVSASAEETQILCKLNLVLAFNIYGGIAYIPPNSNEINPFFPTSSSDTRLNAQRVADAPGVTGTGIPNAGPGNYSDVGILVIQGTIEIQ